MLWYICAFVWCLCCAVQVSRGQCPCALAPTNNYQQTPAFYDPNSARRFYPPTPYFTSPQNYRQPPPIYEQRSNFGPGYQQLVNDAQVTNFNQYQPERLYQYYNQYLNQIPSFYQTDPQQNVQLQPGSIPNQNPNFVQPQTNQLGGLNMPPIQRSPPQPVTGPSNTFQGQPPNQFQNPPLNIQNSPNPSLQTPPVQFNQSPLNQLPPSQVPPLNVQNPFNPTSQPSQIPPPVYERNPLQSQGQFQNQNQIPPINIQNPTNPPVQYSPQPSSTPLPPPVYERTPQVQSQGQAQNPNQIPPLNIQNPINPPLQFAQQSSSTPIPPPVNLQNQFQRQLQNQNQLPPLNIQNSPNPATQYAPQPYITQTPPPNQLPQFIPPPPSTQTSQGFSSDYISVSEQDLASLQRLTRSVLVQSPQIAAKQSQIPLHCPKIDAPTGKSTSTPSPSIHNYQLNKFSSDNAQIPPEHLVQAPSQYDPFKHSQSYTNNIYSSSQTNPENQYSPQYLPQSQQYQPAFTTESYTGKPQVETIPVPSPMPREGSFGIHHAAGLQEAGLPTVEGSCPIRQQSSFDQLKEELADLNDIDFDLRETSEIPESSPIDESEFESGATSAFAQCRAQVAAENAKKPTSFEYSSASNDYSHVPQKCPYS